MRVLSSIAAMRSALVESREKGGSISPVPTEGYSRRPYQAFVGKPVRKSLLPTRYVEESARGRMLSTSLLSQIAQ
jgi:hypothetical protein